MIEGTHIAILKNENIQVTIFDANEFLLGVSNSQNDSINIVETMIQVDIKPDQIYRYAKMTGILEDIRNKIDSYTYSKNIMLVLAKDMQDKYSVTEPKLVHRYEIDDNGITYPVIKIQDRFIVLSKFQFNML